MTKAVLNFRLNKCERDVFFSLCESYGVSPAVVLRTVIRQMIETGVLPIKNQCWDEVPETIEAMTELEAGNGIRCRNVDELMKHFSEPCEHSHDHK